MDPTFILHLRSELLMYLLRLFCKVLVDGGGPIRLFDSFIKQEFA